MKLSLPLLACLALGCAGSLVSTTQTAATAAPDDVYACVQAKLKDMGYNRSQFDATERWYVAEKPDPEVHVPSGLYRRTMMVLDTRVRPDASGNTVLEITARAYDEFDSARGLDKPERQVTNRAKLDAQTLQQACGK